MLPPERLDPAHPPVAANGTPAGLNAAQIEAVRHAEGPLLVLAGAGSGKTRVITQRIAHLIVERGVQPSRIVAVTFTNKAAGEMRERVERLLGASRLPAWIGTFHALCLRILRHDGELVGLASGFNIYDSDDQLAVVRRILRDELGDEETANPPRSFLARISRAKNALEPPEDLERRAHSPERQLLVRVYRRYEQVLRTANAVDFDDLLLRVIELFQRHPQVAEAYSSRCEYLLVDEYQDTNRPQYLLVRQLCSVHGNVCVVGDEDQSIYRFRGAELRNILEFEADHPGTRIIRLEQNYRSTQTILEAAGAVVARNRGRIGKKLWTENPGGEKIDLFCAPEDRDEAVWVAQQARQFEQRIPYEEMAVLYRTNAQSRLLEEIFRRDQIPYQIVGSVQFYERKEIRDLLAYLKLVANPADDVSFRRVVNTPPRGIGSTTLQIVEQVATGRGLPLVEAAREALGQDLIATRSARKLREFLQLVAALGARSAEESLPGLIERLLEATAFESYLQRAYGELGSERMENVRGLVSAAVEYAEEDEAPTLQGFLDRSALVNDADEIGRRPGITLMTIHCAKGLEFRVVFLVGLEEKLFPHVMALDSDEDLEEERRLCYVAMTRAKERLLLAHAGFRRHQGAMLVSRPSRFIGEIPDELIRQLAAPAKEGFFDSWSVRSEARAERGSSAARALERQRRVQVPTPPTSGPQAQDPGDGYRVGAFVKHPSFGAGRILGREGSGKNLKLTIQFGGGDLRKILPSYTQLLVQR